MNPKKRALRAKKKAKQARQAKQKTQLKPSSSHHDSGIFDLGVMPNAMKIGVQDSSGNVIRIINTSGMNEFMGAINEYQEKGYTDIYADNVNADTDGFDAMFIPS